MRYLIRVHRRRLPGETPNYQRDVRHYNADDIGQAITRYQTEIRNQYNSQVELFALLETSKPV